MGVGRGEGRAHEESSAPATVRRHKNEEKDSVLGQWKTVAHSRFAAVLTGTESSTSPGEEMQVNEQMMLVIHIGSN